MTETPFIGKACTVTRERCCGVQPGFSTCASVSNDVICTDQEGFVACGSPPLPGVLCESGVCCQNPLRCCGTGDQTRCCSFGEGEALETIPEPSTGPVEEAIPGDTEGLTLEDFFNAEASQDPFEPLSESPDPFEPLPGPPESSLAPSAEVDPVGPLKPIIETPVSIPDESPDSSAELDIDVLIESPEVSSPSASPGGDTASSEQEGGDDGSVCFPGAATVEVQGTGAVAMKDLKLGDVVRVGENEWSRVIMWTHKDSTYRGRRYVRLDLNGGESFTASNGHIIWVWEQGIRKAVEIESVKNGWMVHVIGRGKVEVENVKEGAWDSGLYNPQTEHGDIVVNGVVATCYTKWIDMNVAHALLVPVRALFGSLMSKWSR